MAKPVDKAKVTRLAIVNPDLCKPEKCASECRKACPVNKTGKQCIVIEAKSIIAENLCIGCGMCQKKCPFDAITIVNLPTSLNNEISHRYSSNGFKLHRLPIPKQGKVVGLVGTNGIGKSTALQILSGKVKPNLGNLTSAPDWSVVLNHYKGSELQGYFTKLLEDLLTTTTKIQYIDRMPRMLKKKFCLEKSISNLKLSKNSRHDRLSSKINGNSSVNPSSENKKARSDLKYELTVDQVLKETDQKNKREHYIKAFDLSNVLTRDLEELSGGELQRFCLALVCMQESDVYIFDEPSSYLDVKQRLTAAREIRNICDENKYVLVVEHDLAILDLMCDIGCVLYGHAGAYGVITSPFSIKTAINIFLDGHIPTENMRFRNAELKFNITDNADAVKGSKQQYSYSEMSKSYKSFKLEVKAGTYSDSEIIVLLGENGMGKSTLVGLISGTLDSDSGEVFSSMSYSLKPQKILPKYKGTVRELFMSKIRTAFLDQNFQQEVVKPLSIEYIYDQPVRSLSGGELQRIAIIMCLGKDANIYLLDEPSAFLDSDQRIVISKIIKRFIYARKKAAFVVEHDLIVGTYLADKVIVFEGQPGVSSKASMPLSLSDGMNIFLKNLDVTFRRDSSNFRPRINKPGSIKDREQKSGNRYFFS